MSDHEHERIVTDEYIFNNVLSVAEYMSVDISVKRIDFMGGNQ